MNTEHSQLGIWHNRSYSIIRKNCMNAWRVSTKLSAWYLLKTVYMCKEWCWSSITWFMSCSYTA